MMVKKLCLEDLAADVPYAIVGGPFGSKLTSADYVEDGIPVIRGTNLNAGRYLTNDGFVYVSEQKVQDDLFGNLARRGDIVFTQRGTLGQVAMIPDGAPFETYVVSQSQMKMTVDPQKADSRFIYYWFTSRDTIGSIVSRNSSSGVPHINLTVLRNFEIPVPDRDSQTRIADVLSAYDDLIENNQKRISLLETAARLLYREWFIHLRFPGHEHVAVIDGVPDGWQRVELGSVLTMKRGYDLPATRRTHGPVPVVSSSGITGYHSEAKASGPGVVTGRYGTLGEVYFVENEYWPLNTALYVSDFKGHDPLFVFQMLKSLLRGVGTQKAAVPGVDRNVLHTMPVVWPPAALRQAFVETVRDYRRQIRILTAMSDKLGEARDLLLPRVMSGEVAV